MLFTSPAYLAFFIVVLATFWWLRSYVCRKLLLLCASYAFYSFWDYRFLSLILISTWVDYWVGILLDRSARPGPRRLLLGTSVLVNLGILGVFKYYGFFVDSARVAMSAVGIPWSAGALDIVLPVGISFYTFQTLGYSIDVYYRRISVCRSVLDFSLFVAFFPQLVAGPIVRPGAFLPQLKSAPTGPARPIRMLVFMFLSGFVKKAGIADNLAFVLDPVFSNSSAFDGASHLLASVLYSIQIYCDFSGYSDMAIASAGFLGFTIEKNFDSPYVATSPREFWRRWHISLSGWLRDYLYIPLGGSRVGPLRTRANVLMTMVLGGLWHGANWTFVGWGALHGALLILHRQLGKVEVPRVVGWVATMCCVVAGWTLFRSANWSSAVAYFGEVFRWQAGHRLPVGYWALVGGLLLTHLLFSLRAAAIEERLSRFSPEGIALMSGVAVALALALTAIDSHPFIYFQF